MKAIVPPFPFRHKHTASLTTVFGQWFGFLGSLLLEFHLEDDIVLGVGLDFFANMMEEIAPATSTSGVTGSGSRFCRVSGCSCTRGLCRCRGRGGGHRRAHWTRGTSGKGITRQRWCRRRSRSWSCDGGSRCYHGRLTTGAHSARCLRSTICDGDHGEL